MLKNTWILNLENFQRIKTAELKFKGFTVIRGESNLGKSSVRRAIESLLYGGFVIPNTKEGRLGYVTKDAKSTKMGLEYSEHKIELERGATKNIYTLDGKVLPKGGRGTPEIIKEIGFNDKELNISGQYEPLFIIGENPTQTTKRINELTGSNLFEMATSLAKRQKKQITIEVRVREEEALVLLTQQKELTTLKSKVSEHEEMHNNYMAGIRWIELETKAKEMAATLKRLQDIKTKRKNLITAMEYLNLISEEKSLKVTRNRITSILTQIGKYELGDNYIYTLVEISNMNNTLDNISEVQEVVETYEDGKTYIELLEDEKGLRIELKDTERSRFEIEKILKKNSCSKCGQVLLGHKGH